MKRLITTIIASAVLGIALIGSSFAGYHKGDRVQLVVTSGCPGCAAAEADLRAHHIPFSFRGGYGYVPQLYVNGKYIGTGPGAVHRWIVS